MKHLFSPFMRKLCVYLLPLGFILTNGNVYGQKTWTLKECVDYALEHNLNVKHQYLNTELAKTAVDQHSFALAPSINGSAGTGYSWGRTIDPFTNQFTEQEIRSSNYSLSGDVTLFNGFQLLNTLRQSKLEYLSGQSDLLKVQNDISLNVVSAYMQTLFAREQLVVFSNRVEEATKQRDRNEIMVNAGTMTKGNLLDAESQLANEELNKVTAENQYSTSVLSLVQLLELDSTSNFEISDPMAEIPEATVLALSAVQIYDAAIKHLPEIKSADFRVKSAEKGLDIARGTFSPRLSMYSSISTGYSSLTESLVNGQYERTPYKDQLNNNLGRTFGLSLSVPIFNGLSAHYNVSRSKIGVMDAELNSLQTRRELFRSIQQAYVDARSAQKKYAVTTKSKESFEEAYTYAEKRFNAGLYSSLEFLTATNNLTKAKTDLLQAKYDYIFKLKILDFYAGNPLTF